MDNNITLTKAEIDLLIDALTRVVDILKKEQYGANATLLEMILEKLKNKIKE